MSAPNDTSVTVEMPNRIGNSHLRGYVMRRVGIYVYVDGINAKGGALRNQVLGFHVDDLPPFIEGMRKLAAGPLGRLAIEAETNTTVVENEPHAEMDPVRR